MLGMPIGEGRAQRVDHMDHALYVCLHVRRYPVQYAAHQQFEVLGDVQLNAVREMEGPGQM